MPYVVQVSPSAYHDVIDALRPDFCMSLADDVPASAGNNRVSVSVRRTAQWLEAFLAARHPQASSSAAHPLPPLTQSLQASSTPADGQTTADPSAIAQKPSVSSPHRHPSASQADASNISSSGDQAVHSDLRSASLTEGQQSALADIPLLAAVVGGKLPRQRMRSAQLAAAFPGVDGFALTGAP